jgi:hypothetical protein
LRSIELSGCGSLSTLPPLPQSLLKLVIKDCGQIGPLNSLPNDLEELSCDLCKKLELDLSNLPMHLKKLSIRQCGRITGATQLHQLPVHLKDLELGWFTNLVSLPPSLPFGLHSLDLQWCQSLAILPPLPESLRKLTLWGSRELENMAPLPDNLEELSLTKCGKLKELDHIPYKLKYLKIDEMKLLRILNFNLPQTLECLNISKSPNIKSGFEKYLLEKGSHTGSPFPPNLRVLELQKFKSLKILPTLPIYLEKLVLADCRSIIEFPLLPPHLKFLEIHHCDRIQYIGSDNKRLKKIGFHKMLPTSLKEIHLYALDDIIWIGDLPPNLESLSILYSGTKGKRTSLPRHLSKLRFDNRDF